MRKLPRHLFVDPGLLQRAYDDSSLPIGEKQTVSQPYMAARMTEALDLGEEKVSGNRNRFGLPNGVACGAEF